MFGLMSLRRQAAKASKCLAGRGDNQEGRTLVLQPSQSRMSSTSLTAKLARSAHLSSPSLSSWGAAKGIFLATAFPPQENMNCQVKRVVARHGGHSPWCCPAGRAEDRPLAQRWELDLIYCVKPPGEKEGAQDTQVSYSVDVDLIGA